MRALIKYVDSKGKQRQKTIDASKNEPCNIMREFLNVNGIDKRTFIRTIKVGNREYQCFNTIKYFLEW